MLPVYPWERKSVDAIGRYHRTPDGAWIFAFPRRKRYLEPFEVIRQSGRFDCRFDGYLHWWWVRDRESPIEGQDALLSAFRDHLGFELMPRSWLNEVGRICSRGDGSKRFWAVQDGYRLRFPREAQFIQALKCLADELDQTGSFHIEWESHGCEVLTQKNDTHRRLRAFFDHHQFRLDSRAITVASLGAVPTRIQQDEAPVPEAMTM